MTEIMLGILMPLMLLGTGLFFLIYLRGYPFRRPKLLCKQLFATDARQRAALLTALAGTLGVGNISGVAAALTLGGAGALFWMWVCALFSMILKYAEIIPAMREKKNGHGGAMYYLPGKAAPVLFALICLACGFSMGNMTQVCAATDAVGIAVPRLSFLVAPAFAILLYAVLRGGKKGIFAFAQRAVPLMTLLYCLLCISLLFRYRAQIPHALHRIWEMAWSVRSVGGGLLGSSLVQGLRYGAARGMISNEAGCGTAPIAHAAADSPPARQGCLGIVEVFVDTILLCTLTGLSVLVSPVTTTDSGTKLVITVFAGCFGGIASIVLALCLLFFAFATAVCWFYYCAECTYFLTGSDRFEGWLSTLFCLLSLFAPLIGETGLFAISDLLVCLMAFLNLPALWRKRRLIRAETLHQFSTAEQIK
ncbi:MAG: sodium:alanine symporter family protein [Ruminococcaceae bacterium]|nr:sodium:alanine symporter family protein [Oscillospiraceae bacterium]